jgi:hypothetical protein
MCVVKKQFIVVLIVQFIKNKAPPKLHNTRYLFHIFLVDTRILKIVDISIKR